MSMSPLNQKIAIGVAGISAGALGVGTITGAILDKNLEKDRLKSLNSITGNSKKARKARIQINKDFNKERKDIDNRVALTTAGAIASSGITGFGLSKIL